MENKDLQPADKKVLQKLPEAQFREISDYNLPPAPPMPETYYKFVEKTAVEKISVGKNFTECLVEWLKSVHYYDTRSNILSKGRN